MQGYAIFWMVEKWRGYAPPFLSLFFIMSIIAGSYYPRPQALPYFNVNIENMGGPAMGMRLGSYIVGAHNT